jgi:hypothetical protein
MLEAVRTIDSAYFESQTAAEERRGKTQKG